MHTTQAYSIKLNQYIYRVEKQLKQDAHTMNMYLFHQVSTLMLKPLCLQLVAIASRLSATVTIDAEQPKCRKQHTDMIKPMQSHTISSMSVKAI